MRKILALILSLAIALTLVGCSFADELLSEFDSFASESVHEFIEQNPSSTENSSIPTNKEHAEDNHTTISDSVGLRPEFKEAMDSYEDFFNEYCDLLELYMENPSDLTLLNRYLEFTTKLVEVEQKFEAWDEEEMTDEELKYYFEVSTRVAEKLANVAS